MDYQRWDENFFGENYNFPIENNNDCFDEFVIDLPKKTIVYQPFKDLYTLELVVKDLQNFNKI